MTAAVMGRIRTNYLIIWSLADAIMILGFIGYILATDFSDFLIFAIVGVYALLINMPREAVLHRTVNMLDQPG